MRTALLAILILLSPSVIGAQTMPRIAILDFPGDENGEVNKLLRQAMSGFELLDAGATRAAARGAGFANNLNPTREDAMNLGASLGCDFYIAGRVNSSRRVGPANESYFEATAAIFLIESQTGRLVLFQLPASTNAIERDAHRQMMSFVQAKAADFSQAVRSAFQRRADDAKDPVDKLEQSIEILDGEVIAKGITPPVFYQRLKPAYTREAALADVTATVEIRAVFDTTGAVTQTDVVRWAGFGLDESAIATVRAMRFKPAQRNGQPVSVLALVQYNFVKPPSSSQREIESERLKQSIRQLGRPQDFDEEE